MTHSEGVETVDNEHERVAEEVCIVAFDALIEEVVDERSQEQKQT